MVDLPTLIKKNIIIMGYLNLPEILYSRPNTFIRFLYTILPIEWSINWEWIQLIVDVVSVAWPCHPGLIPFKVTTNYNYGETKKASKGGTE